MSEGGGSEDDGATAGPSREELQALGLASPSLRLPLQGGVLLSVGVHALALMLLSALPERSKEPRSPFAEVDWIFEQEAPDHRDTAAGDRDGEIPVEAGGAQSSQNIDATDRGQGGDGVGPSQVILLLTRADAVTLQDSPMNAWEASQSQRIQTDRDRASLERRRATPNPHDQVFLASGDGIHRERRPIADSDPQSGARRAPRRTVSGNIPSSGGFGGREGEGPAMGRDAARSARPGAREASPGTGIARGRGVRESQAASVAFGRPTVDEGPAATQAEIHDSAVRDSADAELLASRLVQSWTEATERAGPETGTGRGGVGGGGAPGVGGGGTAGGRAQAHGPGSGRFSALDTSSSRYQRWYNVVRRRVYSRLRFPRQRALAMDQGWSVHRFRVDRGGALLATPELQRSSGFDDFDEAARRAILSAAPFPPPPEGLFGDASRAHAISMRVEHANSMIP